MTTSPYTLKEIVDFNSAAVALQDSGGFTTNTLLKIARLKVRTENPVKEHNLAKSTRLKDLSEKDFKPVEKIDKDGNKTIDSKGHIGVPLNTEVTLYFTPENYEKLEKEFKEALEKQYEGSIELPMFNADDFDVDIFEEVDGKKVKLRKSLATGRIFAALLKLINDENK